MRVLLANHLPLEEHEAGSDMFGLALGLQAAGHAVRAVDVGPSSAVIQRVPTRRVVCRSGDPHADLPFDAPRLSATAEVKTQFRDLSDEQLANYRHTLRKALDFEIAEFDPQIIHCEHIWLFGHLALESGVPYVLTAHGEELIGAAQQERYQRLAAEAAENAGRVIAATAEIADDVRRNFGELEGRITVIPGLSRRGPQGIASATVTGLVELYGEVLDERLGHRWRA
jgi:hypothetical protein